MPSISVLYVHVSGTFGGAGRSLLSLIDAFPEGAVTPHIVTPSGNILGVIESADIPVIPARGISQFDNSALGHYHGVRWLILLREISYLPFTINALRKARRMWPNIEIVHLNDITLAILLPVIKRLFHVPVVLHVRSMQRPAGRGLRKTLLMNLVRRYAAKVVAIDDGVKATLPGDIQVQVVHNGIDPGLAEKVGPAPRAGGNVLRVGFVGNLLPVKGVYEFAEAARISIERGHRVQFRIIGSNTRTLRHVHAFLMRTLGFARDVDADLRRFIELHGLQDWLKLVPFTADLTTIYTSLDVVCFPSYFDAPGRPVFEAAFFRVPSIVCIRNPLPDTLVPGETGLTVPPKDPNALADAIEYFHKRPEEVERMGNAAHSLACRNHDITRNACSMLSLYESIRGREVTFS